MTDRKRFRDSDDLLHNEYDQCNPFRNNRVSDQEQHMSEGKYTAHQLETILMRLVRVADILAHSKSDVLETSFEQATTDINHSAKTQKLDSDVT
jgi:hypothetical protein